MRTFLLPSSRRWRYCLGLETAPGKATLMQTLKVGDVTITSIIERDGPWRKPQDMFPAYDPAIGRQHLASLALSSALLQQAWRAVQPVGSSNDRGTAVAARHDGRNAPLGSSRPK